MCVEAKDFRRHTGGTRRGFDERERNDNIVLNQLVSASSYSFISASDAVRCLDIHAQTHEKIHQSCCATPTDHHTGEKNDKLDWGHRLKRYNKNIKS